MSSTCRSVAMGLAWMGLVPIAGSAAPSQVAPACSKASAVAAYESLPLAFEANAGQFDDAVRFLARGNGYTLWVTPSEAVLGLVEPGAAATARARILRVQLVGASDDATLHGEDRRAGVVNHFSGNDPARWRTRVPTFAKVRYASAYPGIDLVYYGQKRALEYDFLVAPGADPSAIALRFSGAESTRIEEDGSLTLGVGGRHLRWKAPHAYQTIEGRRVTVASAYRLAADDSTIGFSVPAYDRSAALVIDPVLDYSTFLGGQGSDRGRDVAVDDQNHAYVTGMTQSLDFPLADELQAARAGVEDAFVTKFSETGDDIVYSTYLGGTGTDSAYGLALGDTRAVYVTGRTDSNDFPTTAGAYDVTANGLLDGFVVKLDADGQLVYGTYVGGAGSDWPQDIAEEGGRAYVTGYTDSTSFPTTVNAYDVTFNGGTYDAFAFRLGPAGAVLSYSTYLGGIDNDYGYGIALGGDEAVVTGSTRSANFPTLAGFDMAYGGAGDAFVTRLTASGQNLVASTFLGGFIFDAGEDVAVGDGGSVFVTGQTTSAFDFPTTAGVYDVTANGLSDAFVVKLNGALLVQNYGTYVGGIRTRRRPRHRRERVRRGARDRHHQLDRLPDRQSHPAGQRGLRRRVRLPARPAGRGPQVLDLPRRHWHRRRGGGRPRRLRPSLRRGRRHQRLPHHGRRLRRDVRRRPQRRVPHEDQSVGDRWPGSPVRACGQGIRASSSLSPARPSRIGARPRARPAARAARPAGDAPGRRADPRRPSPARR